MAVTQKLKNMGFSTLLAGITDVATALDVQAGHGARFSAAGAGDYFRAIIYNAAGAYELIKVTTRVVDGLTVIVRGQEGTANVAWLAGDRIREVASAQAITDFVDQKVTDADTAQQATLDASIAIQEGLLKNFGFTATLNSPAAGDITLAFKQGDFSTDADADNPISVHFSGSLSAISIVAAKTLKMDTTDHFGLDYATAADGGGPDAIYVPMYIYAIRASGVLEFGVGRRHDYTLSTTDFEDTEGQATGRNKVFCSAVIALNSPCRVVGFFRVKYNQASNIYSEVESGSLFAGMMPLRYFGRNDRVHLATITLSADAAAILDNCITDEFEDYEIRIRDLLPVTDAVNLYLYVSEDNGATWLAGTSYGYIGLSATGVVASSGSNGAAQAIVNATATSTVGNVSTAAASEGIDAILSLLKPAATRKKAITMLGTHINAAENTEILLTTIHILTANAYNAVKFAFSAGNIASGSVEIYGLRGNLQ